MVLNCFLSLKIKWRTRNTWSINWFRTGSGNEPLNKWGSNHRLFNFDCALVFCSSNIISYLLDNLFDLILLFIQLSMKSFFLKFLPIKLVKSKSMNAHEPLSFHISTVSNRDSWIFRYQEKVNQSQSGHFCRLNSFQLATWMMNHITARIYSWHHHFAIYQDLDRWFFLTVKS